ncbi:hypothetical protein AGMMS49936_02220 [Endomicrobiia bacterium]|nr:hypothetical protein AGMMS49936_02220 [Endomicrobiia bacterium]
MNTKTVKTVVKAFVLFGLVLGSTVDVMAVNEQRVQALMGQLNITHDQAVQMAEREEQRVQALMGQLNITHDQAVQMAEREEQRAQVLMGQNVPHEYAVRMAQLEEQLADSSIRMVRQKACNQI